MDVALIGDYSELNKKGILYEIRLYHCHLTHYIIVWLQDFVKHPRISKPWVGSQHIILLKLFLKLYLNHMQVLI